MPAFLFKHIPRIALLLLSLGPLQIEAQSSGVDSIYRLITSSVNDTSLCQLHLALGEDFQGRNRLDSAFAHWSLSLSISKRGLTYSRVTGLEELSFRRSLAQALNNVGYVYVMNDDFKKAVSYFDSALVLLVELNDFPLQSQTFNNLAYVYKNHGDIPKAVKYFEKSLVIKKAIMTKSRTVPTIKSYAITLNNLADIFFQQGNIVLALEKFHESMKLWEEIGDLNGLSAIYCNIAGPYKQQEDYATALMYTKKGLELKTKLNDKRGMANVLTTIGFIYNEHGDPDTRGDQRFAVGRKKALKLFLKAKSLREEINDRSGIARSLSNIGSMYIHSGDPECIGSSEECMKKGRALGLQCYEKSLAIKEELGDKNGINDMLTNIAVWWIDEGNFKKAGALLQRSMKMALELGYPSNIKHAAINYHVLHRKTGNYKKALEYYELYIRMRDSMANETTRKASVRSQLKYEYEKQAAADSVAHAKESEIKSAELKRQSAELKAKKNQQYALFGGLGLVLVFAGFMYNRFKVTQKQKVIIEHQKEQVEEQKKIVEEKQKEILDSIHYAQRIQSAQIPSEARISAILKRLQAYEWK